MSPRPPRPVRLLLLILGGCWLILSTVWVISRERALRVLAQAESQGNLFVWDLPSQLPGPWNKLWPTARLTAIQITRPLTDAPELAWAVRKCGPLDRLTVAQTFDRGEPGRAFLHALGPQRHLQQFTLINVALPDDELVNLLRGFPNVKSLVLMQLSYSGAHFPMLPALEDITIHSLPISDDGLAALLRSPTLRQCWLMQTAVTPAGLRQVPQWQKTLTEFAVADGKLTSRDCDELRDTLETACPAMRVMITSDLSWMESHAAHFSPQLPLIVIPTATTTSSTPPSPPPAPGAPAF